MRSKLRVAVLTVLGALGLGIVAPTAAHAGSRGRLNTTLILGGAAIYGAVNRKPEVAIGAGLGAAYAYSRYRSARRDEDRWDRYYDRGYDYGRRGRSDDWGYGRRDRYDDDFGYGRRGRYDDDFGYGRRGRYDDYSRGSWGRRR